MFLRGGVALRTAGLCGCQGWLVQPCCLELAKGFFYPFRRQAVDGRQAGVLLWASDDPRNLLGHETQVMRLIWPTIVIP